MHTYLLQSALLTAAVTTAAPLIVACVVGFILSIIQAAMQIQEQTLQHLLRVATVFAILLFGGRYLSNQVLAFTLEAFEHAVFSDSYELG